MNPQTFDRLLWRTSKQAPPHPQTTLVDTATVQLRIRDTGGDKPMVVFLCDPPITIEAYDQLVGLFEAEYRVVVIELPGFGFSKPISAEAYEFKSAVTSVESAILQLNPSSLVICGPCICGFVATELARRANLTMAGIVLMQTPDIAGMVKWTEGMDPKGQVRRSYLGQLIVRLSASRLIKFWLTFATAKEYDPTGLVNLTLEAHGGGASYPLATMMQKWFEPLKETSVDIPSLVIWGTQDRSHKRTRAESSLTHVPGADIVKLDNCGHFSELEQPQQFHDVVTPYIGRWTQTDKR